MGTILGFAFQVLVIASFAIVTFQISPDKQNDDETLPEEIEKDSNDELVAKLENVLLPYFQNLKRGRRFGKSQHIPKLEKTQCSKQSMEMSRMMNKSADPCKDFYKYACGGWIADGLPNGYSSWNVFSCLAEEIENKVKSLIEGKRQSESRVGKLIHKWYASCMNQNEGDTLGAKKLWKLIKYTLGKNENLEDMLAAVHRTAVFPLFTVSVDVDLRHSSSPSLFSITMPDPSQNLLDFQSLEAAESKPVTKAYVDLIRKLTRLLHAKRKNSEFEKELGTVLSLHIEILMAMQLAEGGNIETVKISDFQRRLPSKFHFRRYFNSLTKGLRKSPISSSEEVLVEDPQYFATLMGILNAYEKSDIGNYITLSLILEYGQYLSSSFHDAYTEFARKAYGIKESSEPWRKCVRSTVEYLDMAVAMLVVTGDSSGDVDSGFTNETLHRVHGMVDNIREAFIDNLENVKWMDKQTNQAAKEKAEAILPFIGYPHFIRNKAKLQMYYAGMKFNPKSYFHNVLMLNTVVMKNTLRERGKPFSRSTWNMSPVEVNAYYSPTANKIVIPGGILRSRLYSPHHPIAKNYGAIGNVIGHELTHAFDSEGAYFDKDGNLENWWSKTSETKFQDKLQCFVDEYEHYRVQGQSLDGLRTLGENIADNGGIKIAYKAYQTWLAKNNKSDADSAPTTLGLTGEQIFFVSFAQIWCEMSTPSHKLDELEDVHSPGKFRTDVTLKNNRHFAKAFNCPLGSRMNPVHKCKVW